jgi:hypothetical protein
MFLTRFVGSDGKVQKDEKFIPFSTGKTQCPGETLAKRRGGQQDSTNANILF